MGLHYNPRRRRRRKKKFPAFYGTRRFITVFTRALLWYLS
jgi:hypothetical protein